VFVVFTQANPLGGEQEVAPSETPVSRFGAALIIVARAIERLSEILQQPALHTTAYDHPAASPTESAVPTQPVPTKDAPTQPAPTQPAPTQPVPTQQASAEPGQPIKKAANGTRPRGHEPLMTTPSHIPPPVGERAKRSISQDVKIAVSARDGGRCRQCGSTQQLHFDHVIPISRGGANTVANIQLLCGACNRAKGAKLKLTPVPARGYFSTR